jgi:hypothetical protein
MIMVQMNGEADEAVSVEITDVMGRTVYAENAMSEGHKIFVESGITATGIYIMKLSTAAGSATYKVVKQ